MPALLATLKMEGIVKWEEGLKLQDHCIYYQLLQFKTHGKTSTSI